MKTLEIYAVILVTFPISYALSMPRIMLPSDAESKSIRLVGGPSVLAGRLEIFDNGIWGTVCDDYFDERDAKVACVQLANELGISENNVNFARFMGNLYGEGTAPILWNNLFCNGSETTLSDCKAFNHQINCRHDQDVSISCAISANAINPCAETSYREISPDHLYACPQTSHCGLGYHVCESAAELESLGFTSDLCMNIPQDDE
eukprot:524992_1